VSDADLFLADCPARTTLGVIADTWAIVILTALGERPHRHTELRSRIGGISAKVLTQTLRRLQANGLVARRSLATAPRGVEYSLTPLGESLIDPIRTLAAWAETNTDALLAARDAHGSQAPPRPGR
jgi:DNA-binding HxlR family transcriptional regulator